MCSETGVYSARLVGRLMGEVVSALPSLFREALEDANREEQQSFPPLHISAAFDKYNQEALETPKITFEKTSKKVPYKICVKVLHKHSLNGLKESHWPDNLAPNSSLL